MEYLNNHESFGSIKSQIAFVMSHRYSADIEIYILQTNENIKLYNGVPWWYWRSDLLNSTIFQGVS